ncbi:chymotrypsin family serine protease [Streptomyces violascens]|uniref:peptidase n=1 Tax=Streptomyces violascens TaxID=67381 RepID=UPI0036B16F34
MRRTVKPYLTFAFPGVASLAALIPLVQMPAPTPTALTELQIASMEPVRQASLLDPLRKVANAVGAVGAGDEQLFFAGLRIDGPRNVVHVYLTDLSRAPEFIEAAHGIDPGLDSVKITIEKARHTLQELHEARNELLAEDAAHSLPYNIQSVAVDSEHSVLTVAVDTPAAARKDSGRAAKSLRVPLKFIQGENISPASWAATKWHDRSPFIAGDVLTDGSFYCSAGLPAVRKSSNRPVLITAGHCFAHGKRVYTGAGTTPRLGKYYDGLNGQIGNYVGTVSSAAEGHDAEQLVGADNNADESDSAGYKPITAIAHSYNGDYVCQNGAASFFMQQGTVCGIKVINSDIIYKMDNGWTVRGAEGTRLPKSRWAAAHGDSGSMVFSVNGSTRQARGVVSALTTPYQTHAGSFLFWTDAIEIFDRFGLKLNPVI